MPFTVIGSSPARRVAFVSAALAIATIAVCYTVATSLGHVPRWLPDITHCAQYRPEQYIFRVGMIPACTLMWKLWFLIYDWLGALSLRAFGSRSKRISFAASLGCVGSFLLIVASSVISPDPMPWGVHIFGATGFFICTGFAQLLVTYELNSIYKVKPSLINGTSLAIKSSILSFLLVLLVINTLNGLLPLPIPKGFPLGALVEWLAVISVLSYNFTIWKWDWTYMEVATTVDPPQTLPVVAPADSCCAEETEDAIVHYHHLEQASCLKE
mmetsp:Transcript_35061/g.88225  ORF Transcript_35061/g.88225 Transcript_35061/m.88225 type:complete len:270 (+) Transcript_35061:77-886(+)|eukprot:CAMPEP_0177656538 /NCGR_PEP_ID=MMETSP0447-20121125/15628_1 /TAXON_ID=0 /ORGANISM="Stygamoeba regulata, Strain BSH-02190019" /LENGTH=269 /DNA_ID=CAMNT_0019160679 /DNA_START=60 /DNA_END=869 /DNA_ORIENTATION=+